MYEHALTRALAALGLPALVAASGGCSRASAATPTHDAVNAQRPHFSCPQFTCSERPAAAPHDHAPHPFERCDATRATGVDGDLQVLPPSPFDPVESARHTHAAGQTVCCYHVHRMCGGGRALADAAGVPCVAHAVERDDWAAAANERPVLAGLSGTARSALAEHWLREAASEHASVASFARASLRLIAAGAPPELLEGVHRAALDEGARAVGPGALAIPGVAPGEASPLDLADETFVEACVNETVAALIAQAAAERARDPAVRALLGRIAADEARHAELAWATIAWAVRTSGDAVHARIAARYAAVADEDAPAVDPTDAALEAHGVLSSRARAAIRTRALRDVVGPCVRALAVLDRAAA